MRSNPPSAARGLAALRASHGPFALGAARLGSSLLPLLLLLPLLTTGCVQNQPARSSSSVAAAGAAAPAALSAGQTGGGKSAGDQPNPPKGAPPELKGPQPPDGKWLTDENGSKYYLEKMEKVEGHYLRLPGGAVRTAWGIPIQVVKEDDHFFYYKVYRVENMGKGPTPNSKPSEEDLRKVAATYQFATPESHRLAFSHFDLGLPKSGQWRNGFDLADMNEDGHLDIVHGTARKGMNVPVVFLGDGKGNWHRWQEARFPNFPFDYGDVRAADLNGDGHLDLVFGIHLHGVVALLGDGKGDFTLWNKGLDFQEPGHGSNADGFSTRALAITDWNHDGRPDIVAVGEGPRMSVNGPRDQPAGLGVTQSYGPVVYLNGGDGTWTRKDRGTAPGQIFGDSITIGDFRGDGRPGFATGSGVMGAKSLLNLPRADGSWDSIELDVRPGAYVRAVHAADFDHGGRADLAVGYTSYELGIWRSGIDIFYARPGDKWERRAVVVLDSKEAISALGSGDLDGDGNLDLVALTNDGQILVFLGDGKGGFTWEKNAIPPYPGGCTGYHVQLADLDGDGKSEIVAAFAGENSPMYAPDLCPSGGGIQVWHSRPAH